MPADPTAAQSAASRENGSLSHGPTTPEGKARSARNSDRHGLRSAEFRLLPSEDAAAFEALRADLASLHRPAGEAEAACVDELAHAMWRRRRLRRIEDEALVAHVCGDGEAAAGLPSLGTLARYGARIERDHRAALAELDRLRALRPPAKAASAPARPAASPPPALVTSEPEPAPRLNRHERRRLAALSRKRAA